VHEAIKIGHNISVRSVNRNCQRREVILQGTANPRYLVVAGTEAEILQLTIGGGGASDKDTGAGLAVRTKGTIDVALARRIVVLVKTVAPMGGIHVLLRPDKWFLSDCGFPAFYPFENLEVPTKEKWMRTTYATCGYSGQWPIQCFASESR
jgi:hypothetical protein